MGVKDIVAKDYTKENVVFADAFNQYIYKWEQVINPENLRPLYTNLIGLPYGAAGTRFRYRNQTKNRGGQSRYV